MRNHRKLIVTDFLQQSVDHGFILFRSVGAGGVDDATTRTAETEGFPQNGVLSVLQTLLPSILLLIIPLLPFNRSRALGGAEA